MVEKSFPFRRRLVAIVIGRGDEAEDDGHAEHHRGIEQEAAGADGRVLGVGAVVRQKNGQQHDEQVAGGNRQQPEAHDHAFHLRRGFAKGEFQSGRRDEHFRRRDDDVRPRLPENVQMRARFNPGLDQRDQHERNRGQEKAVAHALERRGEPPHARIKEQREDRDEDHDEQGIQRLHLLRADLQAEEADAGHLFTLQNPGGIALVIQRPEHRDAGKNEQDRQDGARGGDFVFREPGAGGVPEFLPGGALGEQRGEKHLEEARVLQFAVGWHEDVILFAAPENIGGDGHQDAGQREGRAVTVMILHPRHDEEREERAEIDGDVKRAVGLLHQVRLVGPELFAHEGGDARLDAAGTERDQGEAGEEAVQFSLCAK